MWRPLRHLIGTCLALAVAVPGAWAQEEQPSAAALIEGLARREAALVDLKGYLLDRAWVEEWYATARGPVVQVTTPGAPATAGGPPPAEAEDRLYSAYFGSFAVAPKYARFDLTELHEGEENLWGLPQRGLTVNVGGGRGGAVPEDQTGLAPDRMVLTRDNGKLKTQRAAARGVSMSIEMTAPTAALAIQQEPLAELLFGGSNPTLGERLAKLLEAAQAAGGAGQAPPQEVEVAGPEEREGQRQYRLAWKQPDGAGWGVWLCPAWGNAPTEISRTGPPEPGERPPAGTERVARRWRFSDFRQLADGLWLPQRVLFVEFLYSPDTPAQHPALARVHELTLYDLADNTAPVKQQGQVSARGQYPDLAAALLAYYPELADRAAWVTQVVDQARDRKRPETPEDLPNAPRN